MYEPRSFCIPQYKFGRVLTVRFVRPEEPAEGETLAQHRQRLERNAAIAAARRQHLYCYIIWRALKVRNITMGAYAEMVGLSRENVERKLRGVRVLSELDIAIADHTLATVHLVARVQQRRLRLTWVAAQIRLIEQESASREASPKRRRVQQGLPPGTS